MKSEKKVMEAVNKSVGELIKEIEDPKVRKFLSKVWSEEQQNPIGTRFLYTRLFKNYLTLVLKEMEG